MPAFVSWGELVSPPNRIASDKIVRAGDVVFIDIGAQWSGYFSDIGRTVICGEPSDRQREIYTAVFDALQAATRTLVAGSTNADLPNAVHEAAPHRPLAHKSSNPSLRPATA